MDGSGSISGHEPCDRLQPTMLERLDCLWAAARTDADLSIGEIGPEAQLDDLALLIGQCSQALLKCFVFGECV